MAATSAAAAAFAATSNSSSISQESLEMSSGRAEAAMQRLNGSADANETIALDPIALAMAATVAAIVTVATVVGNVLVVVAFRLEKQLQTASNCILLSLAVADIGLGAISIPLYSTYWIMGSWPLGSVTCRVWLCFDYTFTHASVAHLLLICLDRFLSVHSPLTYLARRTRRRALVVSVLAWAIPFSIWTPLILAGADGRTEAAECHVEALKASEVASVVTSTLEFFIPMAIILALYFKIYLIVRKRNSEQKSLHECSGSSAIGCSGSLETRPLTRKQATDGGSGVCGSSSYMTNGGSQPQFFKLPRGYAATTASLGGRGSLSPASRGGDSEDYGSNGMFRGIVFSIRAPAILRSRSPTDRSDAKAARTLSAILLAFLITWTPYEVFTVVIGFAGREVIPEIVYRTGFALVYLNSTINPICYALGNVNFRTAFIRILTCKYWRMRSQRRFSIRSQRTAVSMSCTAETIPEVPVRCKVTSVGIFTAPVSRANRPKMLTAPVKQLLPHRPPRNMD